MHLKIPPTKYQIHHYFTMKTNHLSNMKKQVLFVEKQSKSSESYHSNASVSGKADNGNTLGALTKRFVQLIKSAQDQTIQINQASMSLGIQKRRIYDITNVLEGIGYIQKMQKNKMKWVGGIEGQQLERQAFELKKNTDDLDMEAKELQQEIQKLKTLIVQETQQNIRFNYLNLNDIRQIMKETQMSKLFIYEGGIGDELYIDENTENKIMQCTIQSKSKEAKLYLCTLSDRDIKIFQEGSEEYHKSNNNSYQRQKMFINFQESDLLINGSIFEEDQSRQNLVLKKK